MQIQSQSLNYLNAYNAISASSAKTDVAITTSSTANTTSSADVVSISSEAQQLLQASQTPSTTSSASGSKYVLSADSPYKRLSELFHEDPSDAAKNAYEFASNSSNDILYDADSISNPPLRYWASKEVVTPESIKYFNQMKDKATSEKMDIYNSEKAKGTSDADILDMIFAYNDAQPEEYRKMTGWGY